MFVSPLAKKLAGDADLPLAGIQGTGPNHRIIAADVKEALSQPRAAAPVAQVVPAKAAPAKAVVPSDLPASAF